MDTSVFNGDLSKEQKDTYSDCQSRKPEARLHSSRDLDLALQDLPIWTLFVACA